MVTGREDSTEEAWKRIKRDIKIRWWGLFEVS